MDCCGICKYFKDYGWKDRGYCYQHHKHVVCGLGACQDFAQIVTKKVA